MNCSTYVVLLLPINTHKWLEFWYCKADNSDNKTRQGYARKRTLKPAGYSFVGLET